jgi:tetratricopeptide (TPR) repeat protein
LDTVFSGRICARGALVIDDELLQELLVRATGLYNNGDYRGAIAAWREALEVDPGSQKAREGIQMATLLLADWDPVASQAPDPAPAVPADGPAPGPSSRPEADAQRIDQGVKRVRRLILERKYSEAIEGARGLVPIDPDSEEVQRLVEEAQQASESAPFIDEHLTLSRELLDQGRRDEAEAECRKVFALDPANPDAHALQETIQGKKPAAPAPAAAEPAGDLGGRTMRIDRSQLQAFQISTPAPAGAKEPEAAAAATSPAPGAEDDEPAIEVVTEDAPSIDAEPSDPEVFEIVDPLTEPEAASGDDAAAAPAPAAEQEPELDFLAGDSLDLNADADAVAVAASIEEEIPEIDLDGLTLDAPAESAGPAAKVAGAPEPSAAAAGGTVSTPDDAMPVPDEVAGEPEVIEATTVVPPSVRLVERSPEGQAAIDRVMQSLDEDPEAIESIPLAVPSAPVAAASPRQAAAAPAGDRPDAAWEQELESLNQKSGRHEIVGRSAAQNATPAAVPDEDLDLTALMGDEIGPLHAPTADAQEEGPPAEPPRPSPAPPLDFEPSATIPAVQPSRREQRAARLAAMASPPAERRARLTTSLFAMGGLVILAVAAVVWWFFFQPRTVEGRSQPPAAAAPPSASSGTEPANDPGPIPTPIGSTSKQPEPGPQNAPDDGTDAPAPPAVPVGDGAANGNTGPAGAAPGEAHAPAHEPAPVAPKAAPAPARPRSAEEIRQETAQHLAAGKAFLAQERWEEARRELAAALALDPVNFECKELLQKAQAKVDQETKVRQDYDDARRLFQDKDYQGALWKLYRLPKDARFGDLDVAIRNAWYNWAVVALKGGDATTAAQKLNEVFQVDADDADAEKMMKVAAQYSSRPKDRGFYSFVDTLRFRTFDGK